LRRNFAKDSKTSKVEIESETNQSFRRHLTTQFGTLGGSRKAAKVLQSSNNELAIELEELADELEETHEKFGTPSISHTSLTTSESVLICCLFHTQFKPLFGGMLGQDPLLI
jgi:hypothetical protein